VIHTKKNLYVPKHRSVLNKIRNMCIYHIFGLGSEHLVNKSELVPVNILHSEK